MGLLRKDKEPQSEALISSIPVPPADSALVIDLPEGQKLIVGKMEDGTVIEVATWRGTGRPDSRTNRLMLGVSFGGTEEQQDAEKSAVQSDHLAQWKVRLQKSLAMLVRQSARTFASLISLFGTARRRLLGKRESRKTPQVIKATKTNYEVEAFDFERWLAEVGDEPRLKNDTAPKSRNSSGGKSKKPATRENSRPTTRAKTRKRAR